MYKQDVVDSEYQTKLGMTEKKRIFLNVIATYGRTLYSTIIGLFCGRWALMALGEVDFGLFGLVGGLASFVTFLNTIFAGSICRFYAVSVGAASRVNECDEGLEECRKWFNTALSIHLALPIILLAIGYPIGIWAVKNFLTIPQEKIVACVWVWRFTCFSCFIAMSSAPFQAMYTAKQEIAELTIYGFCTTTLNACFLYYMVSNPGIWLTKYAAWVCFIAVVPQIIIVIRAILVYDECRVNVRYLYLTENIVELMRYTVAKFWSRFSSVVALQSQAILVNKFAGPQYNAAMTVGGAVASQAGSLSAALTGAFAPAIGNKVGASEREKGVELSLLSCRYGTILILLFAIPLCLEVEEVFRLWLGHPPHFAVQVCVVILIREVFERMTDGYATAIYAFGKGVMSYSWTIGWATLFSVFITFICFVCGFGMWSVVAGILFAKVLDVVVRLRYGRTLLGLPVGLWLRRIFVPILITVGLTVLFAGMVRIVLPQNFTRLVITTIVSECVFSLLVFGFVFDHSERQIICKWIKYRLKNA